MTSTTASAQLINAARHASDQDTCIQILRERGFLPTGPVGVVNLGEIPDGLDAEELEKFPRKDGAEICGRRSAPADGAPQENQSRSVKAAIQ